MRKSFFVFWFNSGKGYANGDDNEEDLLDDDDELEEFA